MNNAQDIRKALKNELGLNARQVSVRTTSAGSIRVELKVPVAIAPVKAIAEQAQRVSRCEYSGDILGGGNVFVFVSYAAGTLDGIVDAAAVEALEGDACLELDKIQIERDSARPWDFVVWDLAEEFGKAHRAGGSKFAAEVAAQILLNRAA
jgi:hypothetical protein